MATLKMWPAPKGAHRKLTFLGVSEQVASGRSQLFEVIEYYDFIFYQL